MIPLQEQNQTHNKYSRIGVKIIVVVCVFAVIAGAFFYYYRIMPHRIAGEGYSLTVPSGWRIVRAGSGSAEVYPASSSCKIAISSFPAVEEEDRAAWIGGRLGADPSADITERSSEQVSVGGAPAIRWDGTKGGFPAIFIYAFAPGNAYEITPSVANGNGKDDGAVSCEDDLSILMANIQFSSKPQDAFNGTAMDDVVNDSAATVAIATPSAANASSSLSLSMAATSSGIVLGASATATTPPVVASTTALATSSDADDTGDEDCL